MRLNTSGIWKCGLRALTTLLALIGIVALAWINASHKDLGMESRVRLRGQWALPWGIITFGFTILWCGLWLRFLLLRKSALRPDYAVALDVLLWIAQLFMALLIVYAWLEVNSFGQGGTMDVNSD
ncbi:hypothetical protein M011DRAFT_477084 [Sporormia fimetaria CBS 119925]|uniref:MARVEL domain-containing protein n=1 Tax=Sporormia fimetaria CBS 119925 TaxID=1340428 RepID=A0A6A6VE26_9PLEO|nr:hypothetical protein M011DRAFT_477084 [Sporormia fimetaria CBS 119925]